MKWKCHTCGTEHEGDPLCFGLEAPWRFFVPENEFARRVLLNADVCVVDEQHFFVRGHIEIPIREYAGPFIFAVWTSLSLPSFRHMFERWEAADRAADPPYFGWLGSTIPVYPETLNLKLSVQSCAPGIVPRITVEPTEHPLALDQRNGISVQRWHQLAHQLMQA
jgi:hypothetical protein